MNWFENIKFRTINGRHLFSEALNQVAFSNDGNADESVFCHFVGDAHRKA